ncbi:MAG: SMC-Scp complex subunit ScpB [Candidatus Symbiobacter sp.]|nr:SMC-Scp complex subunit ScpB [Candidatus Symbiobacter sp.]
MSNKMTNKVTQNTPPQLATPLRVIEALLFASAEPVTPAIIQAKLSALGYDPAYDVASLMAELATLYHGHGIELLAVGGGFMFRTAPDLYDALALPQKIERKLSRAAMETLAVIAYHQPLTRGEIEEIRGVTLHKAILDHLLATGWVVPKGRRESPGRPILWATSTEFLLHFGLNQMSDLPNLAELQKAGLLEARPNLTVLAMDGDDLADASEV